VPAGPAEAPASASRVPRRVSITRLKLTNFRNYPSLDQHFDARNVVFTGDNGAGKTNLLEAISYLSPGRGLRRASQGDVATSGSSGGFAIHAWLSGADGEFEVGTGTFGGAEADGAVRQVRVNGAAARNADVLLDHLRVVWLTPAMDGLFTGAAGDRRRFIDRMVMAIDPAHGRRTLDYEKSTRSRNRLLAAHRCDTAWLDAIEAQIAETGTAIAAARIECVRLLQAMIARQDDASPFPRAAIALSGDVEEDCRTAPAVDAEEAFRARLNAGRERDRAAGRTLDGPHRSDLLVRHAPKAMDAALCSTGEQKALLIGLTLAHARLVGDLADMAPIMLLDEIAAHLDERRRAALFAYIDELNGQTFMTGTDASLFEALKGQAQFLTVRGGSVEG
jgi:DNA replication and repair protein RecF